ncbi:MAG: hypothetical protein OXI78_03140 [Anaerolineaceae bacterium]|nr:hypothetical protein [Anaerolineaceae bacterium]
MPIPADRIHWSWVLPLLLLAAALSCRNRSFCRPATPEPGARRAVQVLAQALLLFQSRRRPRLRPADRRCEPEK